MFSLPTPHLPGRSGLRTGSRRPLRRAVVLLLAGVALTSGCTGGEAPGGEGGAAQVAEAPGAVAERAPGPGVTPAKAAPRPGTAWVIFGADTVVAEVAATPDTREAGLMYRDEVPDGTGMLFVFDREEVRSFWMQNTFLDLDIAFMDAGFGIVDIQTMEAESMDFTESAAPALYALEVRAGWFGERGIGVGDVAEVRFGG